MKLKVIGWVWYEDTTYGGGEVDYALLPVAQQPEHPAAAAVSQQAEQVGRRLEFSRLRQLGRQGLDLLAVIVGQ